MLSIPNTLYSSMMLLKYFEFLYRSLREKQKVAKITEFGMAQLSHQNHGFDMIQYKL